MKQPNTCSGPDKRMDADIAALTRVLRAALTAVNQQFTHILALSVWGDKVLAERITEVDNVDFATAVRLIDHLVARGAVPSPGPDCFVPGVSSVEVLLAEQAVEHRFAAALKAADSDDPAAKAILTEAAAPRAEYARWLTERIGTSEGACRAPGSTPVDKLFSTLMTWIEQTAIHAFVQWHAGDAAMADATWTSSGAAMMRGTGLTRALAARGSTPAPGVIAAPQVSGSPTEAFERDRQLAHLCAEQARAAAEAAADEVIGVECRKTGDLAAAIAAWEPGSPHPALATNPKDLTSLEAPLRMHVWSRMSPTA